MNPDDDPDWYRLAQRARYSLAGKLLLLNEDQELEILAGKRGSRRWLPPPDLGDPVPTP